ncbi:amidase family protein [Thermoactinospora rubra]|uniref:amidase family protein n=1 Tax=Thermoactinospora rubra TaxID=1088767 RepID=UPI000A108083|nr:amidase family protein [Thermoactinospora rubra]
MTLNPPYDGVAIGERMAAGELDPGEVAERALQEARSPRAAGTFIELTADRAAREAAAARDRLAAGRARSPLDGVPVAVKDLFDLAGTVTTAGSRTRAALPPAERDATVVRRLAAAGMVCVGKTNLSEFAFSGLGINPSFGTPPNPNGGGERLIPGGSSSGSAVAVALGIVPVALGTDTSGSVRVPAAFCGVIGYKASEGRYATDGMVPLAPTLDTVGIFATSMRDVIATDAILTGRVPVPPDDRPLRLVVPQGELISDCTPEVRGPFEDRLTLLARQGADIEERDVPVLRAALRVLAEHAPIVETEAHARYGHLLRAGDGAHVDPGILRRLARYEARQRDAGPVYRAMRALREGIAEELGGAFLACPTVRHPAPPLAGLLADDDLYDRVNRRTLRTTMLFSYLGMPGVSLPIGAWGAGGAGLLLSAAEGRDDALLAGAARVEAASHHGRNGAPR